MTAYMQASKRKPWSPEVVGRVRNVLDKALGAQEEIISQKKIVVPKDSRFALKGFERDDRLFVKDENPVKVDLNRKVRQKKDTIRKNEFVSRINQELVSPVRRPTVIDDRNQKLRDDFDDPTIMEIDWDSVPGQWGSRVDMKPKPPTSSRNKK